jgi:hypothetical protein
MLIKLIGSDIGGRASVVFIMTKLRAGQTGVRVPAGAKDFSVPQNVLTGAEVLPASCSFGIGCLSRGKTPGG